MSAQSFRTPRDDSYFDHLIRLVELERAEDRARFEAIRKTLSLTERAERGFTLLDLEVIDDAWGLGGRLLLVLERADRSPLLGRIGMGDLVELRPRRLEVESTLRGVVARRSQTRLTVALDLPPPPWVGAGRLIVDLMPNDVTFDRAVDAVRQVRALKGARKLRRDQLLGLATPHFDHPPEITPSRPLNPEQLEAVRRALSADDFFLVHGPPGTGKSTVLAEVAVQAAARGDRILATAASNAAVDHLLELCVGSGLRAVRIGHPARVAERLQEYTLDAQVELHPEYQLARDFWDQSAELAGYARRQRKQGRSATRFSNAREAANEARALREEARRREQNAVRSVLDGAQVVCATCAMLSSGELARREFELALLDEATQAIEPIALWPFLKATRVILAGDHQQLPPTVLSREAEAGGLKVSLFERLLIDHGDSVKVMLLEQYRMHETIMAFPSQEMYGGKLRAHPSVAKRDLASLLRTCAPDTPPVLFLDTAGKGLDDATAEGTESRQNPGEADLIVARVKELIEAGLEPGDLAVIAPYTAQVDLLRSRLTALGLAAGLEIDTVDAFQGREKEVVLLSLTRSNADGELGFLTDLRRMNVAITRAKRHLFVVGDSATLSSHPYYQRFIDRVQADGGYRSAWEWPEP